jgi:hypothetical protein
VLDVSSETLLSSIFHTLAYADVFDYPLTAGEVYRYLTSARASPEDVRRALGDEECFARVGDYFTLRGREYIVETRKRRAGVSARLWTHALRYGRMLALLPFVRMVAVTGSLAMNNADDGKDIDFMIVTEPGRLWTVRALSLLIARFARLTGVHLCPNYLVTRNALELPERSLYVAHEVAQMVPLSGMEIYRELRRANSWTGDYLPNAAHAPGFPQTVKAVYQSLTIQRVLELLFRLPFFVLFEKWEMNRKIKRLTREQASSVESYFSADVCKGHIDRSGETVVTALAVRLQLPPLPFVEGRGEGI